VSLTPKQQARRAHAEVFCNLFRCSTGEPTCQKTITLEKASTLFNIAALHTQIGAKKDRTQLFELDGAVECFLKAAGIFQHIIGECANALDARPEECETEQSFHYLPQKHSLMVRHLISSLSFSRCLST
jgi:BRO1-like domain